MRKILMLMLMLLPAAVAEEAQFAPEMLALRKANRAMAEKYCVILNADTGEILRITHSSGGVG